MQNRIYWNNSNNNMQKGIALATCMAIVMGLFTGCGNKNDQQIAASPDEVQKGRYVETELSLPEEWKDKNISQIFRSGDELHFLVAGGAEGQVSLEEWMLGEGDTLTEVTKDWLKALPEGKGLESSDSFTLLQDAEGNQYLYGNCYRDEESSSAHLWKEADGSALDITPQKWLEPMDMDGYRFYDTPQYVTLTEDELLVGLSYFSLDVVLAQDGSLVSSQESDSLTDSGSLSDNKWVSAVGDTLYLAQTDEQGNVNGLLQMQLDGSNGAKRRKCFLFPRTVTALLISVCWETAQSMRRMQTDSSAATQAIPTGRSCFRESIQVFLCRISGAGILWRCRTAVYMRGLEVRAGIK